MRFVLSLAIILANVSICRAQIDTTGVVKPDSTAIIRTDTLKSVISQTDTAKTEVLQTDTTKSLIAPQDSVRVIDNSSTVDLILNSQNEDQTNQLKESLLTEQLEALRPGEVRQKKLIEQQLGELRIVDSIRRVEQRRQIDSLKRHAAGAPVILNRDTIFLIYTNLASFTPNERAELNSEKLLKAAKMFSVKSDSLYVIEGGATSDIMYRETILVSVTDTDALWMDMTRQGLADEYKSDIVDAIKEYRKNIGVLNVLKMIGLCLLVLLIQFGLIKGVTLLFRRVIDKRLIAKKERWFSGIRIRNLEVMDSDRELRTVLFFSKIIRYLLYFLLLYLTIPLLFSVFPPTQRLAETLFGWILTPLASIWRGFVNYLPSLFKIIVIVVVMRYIVKFFKYIAREISSGNLVVPGFYPDWAKATFNILRIFLYAFMLILIFPLLPGSDSGIFQGVSVFVGVLFTLGSTSVIGNLVAGMVITYMRPFMIGDRIRIGDTAGDVIEKSPFVIRVKTVKNEIITVPNSTVLSSNVINYSSTSTSTEQNDGLIINTTITMGYDVPWRQVNQILIDAALKTDMILPKPQPFVLQTSLNDFAASYQLNAYTKNPEKQATIYSQLHQNIQDLFRDAGIEMIVSNYQAVRDGNKSVVPPAPEIKNS